MLIMMFFIDSDWEKDMVVLCNLKDGYDSKTFQQKYEVTHVENTMFFDNAVLITIILVLVIIALVLVIV